MKRLLNRSEFVKNSFILIVGIGFAQVIPVVLQTVLRRFYAPEDFGVFAIYFSIVSTLAIVANFRYAQVVVVPKEDDESLNILAAAIGLVTLFSLFILIVFYFFGDFIIDKTGLPEEMKEWALFVPLSVFFVSGSLVLNSWLTRKKRFKSIAANKIVRRTAEGTAHVGFGSVRYSGGIIWGTLIGDMVNFFVSLFQFKRAKGTLKGVTWIGMKAGMKKYIDYPLYNLLPTILDTVTLFLPVFIINEMFTKDITGQFDLSRQILALPLALISAAISQVLFQKLVENSNAEKPILPIIKKNFMALGGLALLGIVVLYPFSETLFTFLFGDQWGLAGQLTSILAFSYALRFCVTPLSILFIGIKKVKVSSIWQVGYFILISSLFLLEDVTIKEFIFYYMLTELLAYSVYFVLIWWTAKKHDVNLKSPDLSAK